MTERPGEHVSGSPVPSRKSGGGDDAADARIRPPGRERLVNDDRAAGPLPAALLDHRAHRRRLRIFPGEKTTRRSAPDYLGTCQEPRLQWQRLYGSHGGATLRRSRECFRGGAGEAFRVVQHDVVPAVRDRDHAHAGFDERRRAGKRAVGLG